MPKGRAGFEPGGLATAPASAIGDGAKGHHMGAPRLGLGGRQSPGRRCPRCSQVAGGETEAAQQAGTPPGSLRHSVCSGGQGPTVSGGGAGAGHFPGRAATTCPQALGTGLATPRSPTSGRRMDSVPDSPPAQGPHPAAPGPSPSCPITRRAIGAPQLRQPRDCAVGRGHSEAGTARPARPVWRLTGVCLGGCGDARASGPGRGGAGMRRVFPAPAPLINKGSGHGRVGPVL